MMRSITPLYMRSHAIVDQFIQGIPEIDTAIKERIFTKISQMNFTERGLTAEERALFERLFYAPDIH